MSDGPCGPWEGSPGTVSLATFHLMGPDVYMYDHDGELRLIARAQIRSVVKELVQRGRDTHGVAGGTT